MNELTITIGDVGGGIDPRMFARILRNLPSLLEQLDREITHSDRPATEWRITHVSMQSPLALTFVGRRAFDNAAEVDVVEPFITGFRAIQETPVRPRHFSDAVLARVKDLALSSEDNAPVKISGNGSGSLYITDQAARNAEQIRRRNRRPYSTVVELEGRLESINVHGTPEFYIYDRLTRNAIRCFFDESLARELGALLTRRIRVAGKARFSENHEPQSVKVSEFRVIPEAAPSIRQLHEEKINITGGKDSVDYVRGLRERK